MKDLFSQLDELLLKVQNEPEIQVVLQTITTLLQRIDLSVDVSNFELSLYKEVQDMSYLIKAPGFTDKKAVYEYIDTSHALEIRVFFCSKIKKAHIAKSVALTPNFEDYSLDKPVNFSKPIGLDFFIDTTSGEIVLVTSSEHQLRTMSLKGKLRNTQKTIFDKRSYREKISGQAKQDISIKARNHKILWDSLSLKELNKQFYVGDKKNPGIISFFSELKQHISEQHASGGIVFDDKYASQFVARMFGRIIFCEFLRKKGLINEEYGYYDLTGLTSSDYYQQKLQYLFFEILNTELDNRVIPTFTDQVDIHTPFLNGGLFEAKETDHYNQGTISFPDDFFHRFYGFLESYNFTTDESSSDYQQVAIDPEMLGRIFENLLAEENTETGEQARKAKGAFYTPREIVDYMCRESLRQYLLDALGDRPNKEKTVQVLMNTKDHAWDRNKVADIKDDKVLLIQALDTSTIIDPACGSGAFPMGMVQLMTKLYERLDPKYDAYKVKFSIIKNSIYGVDIEPMAVEISRLRAWLSLIVDEEFQPQQENGGIESLPNLDFKFVCANSLIKLEGSDAKHYEQVGGMFDTLDSHDKSLDKKLTELRDEFFDAKPTRKKKIKDEFKKTQQQANGLFLNTASERVKQLATYDPFNASSSAGFFDPKFMFGITSFDIVIGNPPYVSFYSNTGSTLPDNIKKSIVKDYIHINKSNERINLMNLFVERGISLLNEYGCLSYITNKTLAILPSYHSIRKFILDNASIQYIVNNLDPFDAVVDCTIIGLQKNKHLEHQIKYYLGQLNNYQIINSSCFKNNENTIFHYSKYNQVLKKMLEVSGNTTLGDLLEINRGINIGGCSEFFLSKEKKDGYEKYIAGTKGINKYSYSRNINDDFYLKFDQSLEMKLRKNGKTLVLGNPQRYLMPRLFIPESSQSITAVLVDELIYSGYGIMVATLKSQEIELAFLCGLLNSKLINFYCVEKEILRKGKKATPHVGVKGLNSLPIKSNVNGNQYKEVINLVKEITNIKKNTYQANISTLQNKIDQLIYQIYELTDEEIASVEAR